MEEDRMSHVHRWRRFLLRGCRERFARVPATHIRWGAARLRTGRKREYRSSAPAIVVFVVHPVISPDANNIAYISGNQLLVWHQDQLGPRELYRFTAMQFSAVFWSPDSQTIAFGNDRKLW